MLLRFSEPFSLQDSATLSEHSIYCAWKQGEEPDEWRKEIILKVVRLKV